MKVGWIGIGAMGAPMASKLAASGHRVVGFDLDPGRAVALVEAGIVPAANIEEVVSRADVVVIMVATPGQVNSLLYGDGGLAEVLEHETILMIMATVGPVAIGAWAEKLAPQGVDVVDAPVSGGVVRAGVGDLLIMVGGRPDTVEQVRPVLGDLGSTVVVAGDRVGDGQRLKMVNQLLCGVHIAAAGEALALAEALGMDPRASWEALRSGAAASFMLDDRGARMVGGDFAEVKSALDIFVKDMGLVTESAKDCGYRTPLASTAEQLYLAGQRAGFGSLDDSSIIDVFRDGSDLKTD